MKNSELLIKDKVKIKKVKSTKDVIDNIKNAKEEIKNENISIITTEETPENFNGYSQNNNICHYTPLKDDLTKLRHSWMCKDYFNDLYYIEYNNLKEGFEIYKMHYDLKEGLSLINREYNRMVIEFITYIYQFSKDNINNSIKVLNLLEERLGFKKTTINLINNDRKLLITYSTEWTISGGLIGLYTLLLRVLFSCVYDKNLSENELVFEDYINNLPKYNTKCQINDLHTLSFLTDKEKNINVDLFVKTIVENVYYHFSEKNGYYSGSSYYSIHNSGFIGIFNNMLENRNKWFI